MNNVSVHDLAVFLAVARSNSFSLAADALYMTQSCVSKVIMKLEKQMEVRLFDRSSHHVEPTPAGRHLFDCLLQSLPPILDAMEEMRKYKQLERINIVRSIPNDRIALLINSFQALHHSVNIGVSARYDPFMGFSELISKKADLWITPDILLSDDYRNHLQISPIHTAPVYAIMPLDHKFAGRESVSLDDISSEIIISHADHTGQLLKAISIKTGLRLNISDRIADIRTRSQLFLYIYQKKDISLLYQDDLFMLPAHLVAAVPITEMRDCQVVAAHTNNHRITEDEESLLNFLTANWEVYLC